MNTAAWCERVALSEVRCVYIDVRLSHLNKSLLTYLLIFTMRHANSLSN